MSPGLSVIIVHYKTPDLLDLCVSSLFRYSDGVDLEVIVVNNDEDTSTRDRLIAKFPDLVWIEAGYNAGFSRANNMGIRKASRDYLLILNPDAEIKEGFLQKYLAFYIDKDRDGSLGLVGCRVISSVDGSLSVGTGTGFPSIRKLIGANPLYIYFTRSRPKKTSYDASIMHYTTHEVDFVSGSCEMIKREKVVKNRLFFDEDFFLYSEDVEWSHRIKSRGLKNYFLGEVEVYHVNSASTGHSQAKLFQVQVSIYLYYLKAFGLLYYLMVGFVLWLNFTMDLYFLRKSNGAELSEVAAQYSVFKKFYFLIIKNYYFQNGNRQYLKYN
jgi:hypothetical protein